MRKLFWSWNDLADSYSQSTLQQVLASQLPSRQYLSKLGQAEKLRQTNEQLNDENLDANAYSRFWSPFRCCRVLPRIHSQQAWRVKDVWSKRNWLLPLPSISVSGVWSETNWSRPSISGKTQRQSGCLVDELWHRVSSCFRCIIG